MTTTKRPDYCDFEPGDPCRQCGATVSGKDPVHGVCQARFNGPRPQSLLQIVLIDKHTGEIVASTR